MRQSKFARGHVLAQFLVTVLRQERQEQRQLQNVVSNYGLSGWVSRLTVLFLLKEQHRLELP